MKNFKELIVKDSYLKEAFNISKAVIDYVNTVEKEIEERLKHVDTMAEYHQYKVIKAMQNACLADRHFHPATGYGYDDVGREVVESIYAEIFGCEDALVRPHISSGTHAISICLYGVFVRGIPFCPLQEALMIRSEPLSGLKKKMKVAVPLRILG